MSFATQPASVKTGMLGTDVARTNTTSSTYNADLAALTAPLDAASKYRITVRVSLTSGAGGWAIGFSYPALTQFDLSIRGSAGGVFAGLDFVDAGAVFASGDQFATGDPGQDGFQEFSFFVRTNAAGTFQTFVSQANSNAATTTIHGTSNIEWVKF